MRFGYFPGVRNLINAAAEAKVLIAPLNAM